MRNGLTCWFAIAAMMLSGGFASAQFHTVYSPYVPIVAPAVTPTTAVYPPPMVVARPMISAPITIASVVPSPVVTAYRPVLPTYVAPTTVYRRIMPAVPTTYVAPAAFPTTAYSVVPAYSAYRPVVSATLPAVPAFVPVAPAAVPVYSAASVYRPGVVGTGIGGVPTVYTPGQPLRNALRYLAP